MITASRSSSLPHFFALSVVCLALSAASYAAAPANDNFANAQTLTSGVEVSGLLGNATRQPGDPPVDPQSSSSNYPTVWYQWTAPASGVVRLSLSSSMEYNSLVTMIGTSPSSGKYLTDDGPSSTFYAVGGQTYHICFLAYAFNASDFSLTLDADASLPSNTKLVPPYSNDDFANGYVLTGRSSNTVVPTLYATIEPSEQDMRNALLQDYRLSTYRGTSNGGVWLNWTAPTSGSASITARNLDPNGNHYTLVLAVTGNSLANYTFVNGGLGGMQFDCTANTTYHIYVLNPYSDMALVNLSVNGATSPFNGADGYYFGSFNDGSGIVQMAVSKSGQATIRVVTNIAVTGHIAAFDLDGHLTGPVTGQNYTTGSPTRTFDLQLGTAGNTPADNSITGTVDGKAITLYHSLYYPGRPALAEAGKYTVLLDPTVAPTSITTPGGTGVGVLTIDQYGTATLAGNLADNSPFSVAVPLVSGSSGHSQMIAYAYGSNFFLSGDLIFSPSNGDDATGSFAWAKATNGSAYYSGGFTTQVHGRAARYSPPFNGRVLAFADKTNNAGITFTGGGLAAAVSDTITLQANNTIPTSAGSSKAGFALFPAFGYFLGISTDSTGPAPLGFGGVFYQNANSPRAAGYFIGPVKSGVGADGSVLITPK